MAEGTGPGPEAAGGFSGGYREGSSQARLRQIWSARQALTDIPKGPERQKRAEEINTAFKALKNEVGIVPFLPIDRAIYEQLDREWAAVEAKKAKEAAEAQKPPKKEGFWSRFLNRIAEPESIVVSAVNTTARTFDPKAPPVETIEPKAQTASVTQSSTETKTDEKPDEPPESSALPDEAKKTEGTYQLKPGGNLEKLSPEEQHAIIATYKDHEKLSVLDSLDEEAFQTWFQQWELKVKEYKRRKAAKET